MNFQRFSRLGAAALFALLIIPPVAWATVSDENYEDNPGTVSSFANPYDFDGWRYTHNDPGSSAEYFINTTFDFTGQSMVVYSSGPDQMTQLILGSQDGSEFKLVSFDLGRGVADDLNGVTITGWRDGVQVAGPVNASGLTYAVNVGADAAWENIDQFRINGSDLSPELDNIDVSPAVVAAPDPPVIGNLDGDIVAFTEDGAPALIDAGSNATITDADTSPLAAGATLTISVTGATTNDQLSLDTSGSPTLSLPQQAGSTFGLGATILGSLVATTTGVNGEPLALIMNNATTATDVAALLQAVTYEHTGDDPPASRTLTINVTDGDGQTSTDATVTVNVTGVNDEPVVAVSGLTPTFTEGGSAVALFSGASIDVVEAAQNVAALSFELTSISDPANARFTFDGLAASLTTGAKGTTTNGFTASVSLVGTTATASYTGGSVAAGTVATLINAITFDHLSPNPAAGNRGVTLVSLGDSGSGTPPNDNTANPGTAATVTVVPVTPAPSITTPIEGDDFINSAEDADVVVVGTGAAPGATVDVSLDDTINPPVTAQVTADGSGNWTLAGGNEANVAGLNDGSLTVSATQTDTRDAGNNTSSAATTIVTLDNAAPTVLRIERLTPTNQLINIGPVVFRVTFSEDVTGVDTSDFNVIGAGSTGALVTGVATVNHPSPDNQWDVTVGNLAANGTVGLEVITP